MKTCFIEQTCGLGDILLSIKIANHFADLGHRVVWPIEHVYQYLPEYIDAPNIEFVDIGESFPERETYLNLVSQKIGEVAETEDYVYVPLKNSFFSVAAKKIMAETGYHDLANMHGKFAMCSLDSKDWQDAFTLKRNREREERLFKKLKLENGPYHLVNKSFGTPPRWNETLAKEIPTPYGTQRVMMHMDPEFTAFDWFKVLEKADRIDTVSTSTFYLFEKIDLECIPTIYSRNTPHRSYNENFGWLQTFARKPYLYIG